MSADHVCFLLRQKGQPVVSIIFKNVQDVYGIDKIKRIGIMNGMIFRRSYNISRRRAENKERSIFSGEEEAKEGTGTFY